MSGTAETADLYSAIENAARQLDVPCSRDKIWPIITAYADVLPHAVIAFRVATSARHAGELDYRFSTPRDTDPYAVALSNGLAAKTDHPVGTLLSDIHLRCPIDKHGVEFGVVGGFKKVWTWFPPDDWQELSTLADIPSMPRSLAGNIDYFARHGLTGKVSIVGIDYQHRTVNVYFGAPPAEVLERETVLAMHREIGLPDPSEQMLKVVQKAYGIYFTLSWDSAKIERIAFPIMTPDPLDLPVRLDPKIEQFVRIAPRSAADHMVFYVAVAPSGEYYKIGSFYRWQSQMKYVDYEKTEPAAQPSR